MIKMRAAVIRQPEDPYTFEDVELSDPKGDEVLVKIKACGLCHTDDFGRTIHLPMPLVLGHEGAGIVEKVGEDVTDLVPGDHVAFSYASCGHCRNCLAGMPQYCLNFNKINFGGTGADGITKIHQNGKPVSMFFGQSAFAQYATISSRSVIKVDPDIDLAIAAPMGCGIQTGAGAVLNTLKPEVDESIAVFGCGAVGMSAIMAAAAAGCRQIIAVGGNPKSLALAKELGATDAVNRKELAEGTTIAEAVAEVSGGGVNYAIDTSGNGNMIQNAIRSTILHGKVVLLAPTGSIADFNVGNDVLMNYRTIIGCCEGDSVPKIFIPRLLQLYKEGKFPVDKIIKTYDFADINQARADSNSGKVIKAVVTMK
ncbi:MAG: NAD(P)-dependent alcohol dehydrogenase [Eubacteriales bacterium]